MRKLGLALAIWFSWTGAANAATSAAFPTGYKSAVLTAPCQTNAVCSSFWVRAIGCWKVIDVVNKETDATNAGVPDLQMTQTLVIGARGFWTRISWRNPGPTIPAGSQLIAFYDCRR